MAIYTVPRGFTCYLTGARVDNDANKSANFTWWRRQAADDTAAPVASFRHVGEQRGVAGPATWPITAPIAFPEKTDIWVEAAGNGGVADVAARFELACFRD